MLTRVLPRTIDDPVFWLRVALIFVAAFAFTRGWRYTIDLEPVPMAIQIISTGFSVVVYGWLWFLASLAAVVSIPRAWPGGSFLTMIFSLLFAFGFTISWLASYGSSLGTPGRADYANASTYWTVLGLLACGYFLSRKALAKGTPSPGAP